MPGGSDGPGAPGAARVPGAAGRPGTSVRLRGLIRLAHPFPSLLDGLVVGAVALVAGGDGLTAARLALSMTALQVSIGALNDVIDAPTDAGHKPGKPIPAGLVPRRLGLAAVVGGAGIGLALGAPSGSATVALAIVGLAIGFGYDLVFKGTVWSWVPFAVGIPLLPVYGWVGVAGSLPGSFVVLVPLAVVTGAGLSVANARADTELDTAAGVQSVAIRLGERRSWLVDAVLLGAVVIVAIATLAATGASAIDLACAVGAGLVVGLGVFVGRGGDRTRREWGWELQAVGAGLLAAVWLAGTPLGG